MGREGDGRKVNGRREGREERKEGMRGEDQKKPFTFVGTEGRKEGKHERKDYGRKERKERKEGRKGRTMGGKNERKQGRKEGRNARK